MSKPALWKQILRSNFTRWEALADFLELNPQQRKIILQKPRFPLNLPLRLAEKIVKGTLDDPILRQFLPSIEEEKKHPLFLIDPVGDQACRPKSKLLHKYQGRVLLVCTSACAMHCRYCFRQNFDYDVSDQSFDEELDVIANDPSIYEVILSGGDPLSLSDRTLQKLLEDIDQIPHIKRIRFHTRFPIGIPERIDENFLSIISKVRCQIWFVIHSNHARELDDDIFSHLKNLHKLGVVMLNQSVLLRGVNDSVEALKQLCETLANHGILPYYLHQLDRVQGSAHFEVSEEEGRYLIQEIAKQLSGYAVPKYVREISGETGKTKL
jgi:EF-P beta-lysylation protein EpmB